MWLRRRAKLRATQLDTVRVSFANGRVLASSSVFRMPHVDRAGDSNQTRGIRLLHAGQPVLFIYHGTCTQLVGPIFREKARIYYLKYSDASIIYMYANQQKYPAKMILTVNLYLKKWRPAHFPANRMKLLASEAQCSSTILTRLM
ncbi:Uncharacterized protein APZ42_013194 [Daphnia magna]|uniref:Uncharacterized protein n=1 Tax=Daphnia magna TaxID=35525 RepID=A0A162R3G2_9CRUS|nr:Uncharacterized protein APZ42_013194 [Daphnia magna]